MLPDFHTHSMFSGDSEEKPENMIEFAIKNKMKYFCFTDHLDLDYPEDDVDFNLDVDSYYPYIYHLKELYSDKIDIRIGVECGLEPHLSQRLNEILIKYPFDYIIGSSHLVNGKDPYYASYFEGRTNKEAYGEYFESILKCVDSCSNFDVYGHLDYVIRYTPYKDDVFSYSDYSDVIDCILKKLTHHGKGIEVNTGGYNAGLSQPNPSVDIIKRYRELGGEILTVGSDAHKYSNIGSHFEKASELLKKCGFDYVTIFENRSPEFVKI